MQFLPRTLKSGNSRQRHQLLYIILCLTVAPASAGPQSADIEALQSRVSSLQQQLAEAQARLAEAQAAAEQAEPEPARGPDDGKIRLGPVTIGGAVRVNYVNGDYSGSGDGPRRGGNGGNFELDTWRINASLDYGDITGKFEYRWYNGYNFLHTLWLGYDFGEAGQVQAGVIRVPFGPGPYGISQSWFFDQHYYLGLADDMDLGIKYLTRRGNWDLALAWFPRSEGNWNGNSADSARYSYDAVKWRSAIEPDGDVVAAPVNGYSERNQFNLRAIYHLDDAAIPTAAGVSLQAGQLDGKRADDADHWAASVHMTNRVGNLTLATQLTRYEYDIDAANDSQMLTLGSAFASGGWYIYADYVRATGNLFIGNRGDDYSNIYRGVGDFGIDGNDRWNDRFNINFGYYY